MWVLFLNDMRMSNIENVEAVARASTREALQAFVESQRVEPYSDGRWLKNFAVGGPLEWYNPPFTFHEESFIDVGTKEDWMQRAEQEYNYKVLSLQDVTNGQTI